MEYFAEYSFGQGQYHIGRAKELVKKNKNFIERVVLNQELLKHAFIPFAFGTYEECEKAIEEMRRILWNKSRLSPSTSI